jgi:hypothetical protein
MGQERLTKFVFSYFQRKRHVTGNVANAGLEAEQEGRWGIRNENFAFSSSYEAVTGNPFSVQSAARRPPWQKLVAARRC